MGVSTAATCCYIMGSSSNAARFPRSFFSVCCFDMARSVYLDFCRILARMKCLDAYPSMARSKVMVFIVDMTRLLYDGFIA